MNVEEALAEAKRRWGPDAGICSGTHPMERCQVGAPLNGRFAILGRGRTWAEALADATRSRRGSEPGRRAG